MPWLDYYNSHHNGFIGQGGCIIRDTKCDSHFIMYFWPAYGRFYWFLNFRIRTSVFPLELLHYLQTTRKWVSRDSPGVSYLVTTVMPWRLPYMSSRKIPPEVHRPTTFVTRWQVVVYKRCGDSRALHSPLFLPAAGSCTGLFRSFNVRNLSHCWHFVLAGWYKCPYCCMAQGNVLYQCSLFLLTSNIKSKPSFSISDRAPDLVTIIRTRMMRPLLYTTFHSNGGGVSYSLTSNFPFISYLYAVPSPSCQWCKLMFLLKP